MFLKICLIQVLAILFSFDLSKCNDNSPKRITVTGRAIQLKHDAAIRTDDSLIYYLNGIDDWEDKFIGKRVRVTGKLVVKNYDTLIMNSNPKITAIPQQRRGVWKIIEKPKWKLVE